MAVTVGPDFPVADFCADLDTWGVSSITLDPSPSGVRLLCRLPRASPQSARACTVADVFIALISIAVGGAAIILMASYRATFHTLSK